MVRRSSRTIFRPTGDAATGWLGAGRVLARVIGLWKDGDVPLNTPNQADAGRRSPKRQWASSELTRKTILDAAREVFSETGYEHTSIDDVVSRSGVSVGSIYHQIGGKAALFQEVAAEVMASQARASHAAVAAARSHGETRQVELYLIGATAYLMSSWQYRQMSRVMLGDDRPAGFTESQDALVGRMIAGTKDIVLGDPPDPELSSAAVVALLRTGSERLISVDDEAAAEAVVTYFISLLRRLASSGV